MTDTTAPSTSRGHLPTGRTGAATGSTTDPLTGLLNRTGWAAALAGSAVGRPRLPVGGVIALAVDGIAEVNARHGVQAGDRLLRAVADAITATCPLPHRAARRGDQFAVLVEDSRCQLSAVAAAILDGLAGVTVTVPARCSISAGWAATGAGTAAEADSRASDRLAACPGTAYDRTADDRTVYDRTADDRTVHDGPGTSQRDPLGRTA